MFGEYWPSFMFSAGHVTLVVQSPELGLAFATHAVAAVEPVTPPVAELCGQFEHAASPTAALKVSTGQGLFWQKQENRSHKLYECLPPIDVCQFDQVLNDSNATFFDLHASCRANHTGPLCSVCLAGYSKINGYCQFCQEERNAWLSTLVSLGVLLSFGLFYSHLLTWRNKKAKTVFLMLQASFFDWAQMTAILLEFPFTFPQPLLGLLKGIAAATNFDFQGLSCMSSMPHRSLVPLQVFSILIVMAGFIGFVMVEWAIVRLRQHRINIFSQQAHCGQNVTLVAEGGGGEGSKIVCSAVSKTEEICVEWESVPQRPSTDVIVIEKIESGLVFLSGGGQFRSPQAPNTLWLYVHLREYNKSLLVGLKFIFSLFCTTVARASFGTFVCLDVYGVSYLSVIQTKESIPV
jgi:hypothetical protein